MKITRLSRAKQKKNKSSMDEKKRICKKLISTLSCNLPCVVFRVVSKLKALCGNSVSMKIFLCDLSFLNRKSSNVEIIPSRASDYLEIGNQDSIGFIQVITELCTSLEEQVHSKTVRHHVVRLLRKIASFDEGVGFLRYWMHPNDLLLLFSQPYDNLVSTLALNAIIHRLLAEKRLAAVNLPVPMICGFLYRKTSKKSSWRRRWFVITMDCLLEYSGDTSKKSTKTNLHRKTMLAGCVACVSSEEYRNIFGSHFRTFEIHIPCGENVEEVFYYTAQNDVETQKWIVALDRAISKCNTGNGVRWSAFQTEENTSTGTQRMKRKRDGDREIQRINSRFVPESPMVELDSNFSPVEGEIFPYRQRSSFSDSQVVMLNQDENVEDNDEGPKPRRSPPLLIVPTSPDRTISSSINNTSASCTKCKAPYDSHSRRCVKCLRMFCIECKKSEMQKLSTKTWKCLENCSARLSHRMAALDVSDEDTTEPLLARKRFAKMEIDSQIGDAKEKSGGAFTNVTSAVMKLGRGLNKIVGIRDTEKKNFRSAEILHASRLLHPDLFFIPMLCRRARDKDMNILFRIKAAQVIMHLFYYESHKINPKHDRSVRVDAVESAMSAILCALRLDPIHFGTRAFLSSRYHYDVNRQMASLAMEWNNVLELFALSKAVIIRTGLLKEKLHQYEKAVNLRDSESRLVSLLEANYTMEIKGSLDRHYRGLMELQNKIMIETEKRKEIRSDNSAGQTLVPAAPKNASSRNSKKKHLARYNSRKMSMFHAAKFASVHDEFRRVVEKKVSSSSTSGDVLIVFSKIKLGIRLESASLKKWMNGKNMYVRLMHRDQEHFSVAKMVGGDENEDDAEMSVSWNQNFSFNIDQEDHINDEINFHLKSDTGSEVWIGSLDLPQFLSQKSKEGLYIPTTVRMREKQGKNKKNYIDGLSRFVCLNISVKWRRRRVRSHVELIKKQK